MLLYFCKLGLKMKIHCFNHKMFCTSALSPLQLPSRAETHLWYVLPNEVKSQSLLSQYVDLLSPVEKDHMLSMRGELQKSALIARALVRTTISRYTFSCQSELSCIQKEHPRETGGNLGT